MQLFLFYLAIVPTLFIFYFSIFFRKKKREDVDICLMLFFFGCMSALPAYMLELLYSYFEIQFQDWAINFLISQEIKVFLSTLFGIAIIEESCKLAVVRIYAYPQIKIKSIYDAIVYSVLVSIGFASIENLIYVYVYSDEDMQFQIALMRMISAVPAHALMGIFMGYYIGKAKLNEEIRVRSYQLSFLIPVFIHTGYDYFLLLPGSSSMYSFIILAVFTIFAVVLIRSDKTHLVADDNSVILSKSRLGALTKSTEGRSSNHGSPNSQVCAKCNVDRYGNHPQK